MDGVDGMAFNYLDEVIFQKNTNLVDQKKIQKEVMQIARNRGKLRSHESRHSKPVQDNVISNDESIIGTHKNSSKYSDTMNKLQDKKLEMVPKRKISEDSFKAAYWEIISEHFLSAKNTLSITSDDKCLSQQKTQRTQSLQTEKTPHIKIWKIENKDLLPITESEFEESLHSESSEKEVDEIIPLKINPIEEESKRVIRSRIEGDYIEIYRRLWEENVFGEKVDKTIKI
jgi:hypothetical protein